MALAVYQLLLLVVLVNSIKKSVKIITYPYILASYQNYAQKSP